MTLTVQPKLHPARTSADPFVACTPLDGIVAALSTKEQPPSGRMIWVWTEDDIASERTITGCDIRWSGKTYSFQRERINLRPGDELRVTVPLHVLR